MLQKSLHLLTLLVGRQEGHAACKKTVCWFVGGDDLTGAWHIIASVIAATAIILSSCKIQNGDILVPANPGPPGIRPLKRRERVQNMQARPLLKGIYVTVYNLNVKDCSA